MSNIVRYYQAMMGRQPSLDLDPPAAMPPAEYWTRGQSDPSMRPPAMPEPQMSVEFEDLSPQQPMFVDQHPTADQTMMGRNGKQLPEQALVNDSPDGMEFGHMVPGRKADPLTEQQKRQQAIQNRVLAQQAQRRRR